MVQDGLSAITQVAAIFDSSVIVAEIERLTQDAPTSIDEEFTEEAASDIRKAQEATARRIDEIRKSRSGEE